MIARSGIVERIQAVYERFGFVQLDTPILESLETLTGSAGLDVNKEIFTLLTPEGENAALRFDLTVPFARLVSQYRDQIKLPFRRYHVGPVFRADKPGPGRYRQFTKLSPSCVRQCVPWAYGRGIPPYSGYASATAG